MLLPVFVGKCFSPIVRSTRLPKPVQVSLLYLIWVRKTEESPSMRKARPKHLNLFQIRQPVPAVVSILHRISGAGLFLFLWLFIAGLERSLSTPEAYAEMRAMFGHPLVKLLMLGLVWAFLHHTFAGIRHLGLDLRLGVDLPKARATAWAVMALSLALTIVIGIRIW